MGNLLSSGTEDNIDIRGDGSGNTGSNNKFSSDNTTTTINYYGGANSSRNHAEILQCLYTSRYESHRGRVCEPAEGTCKWVTEHPKYKDWSGERKSGLLWLSADPGCGKSVTASFLVGHLKSQTNAVVCYFFFKDDSEEQRGATFALCAILHQLFKQRKSLCRYAEEEFKDKGKIFTEEVDTLWDILVKAVTEGGCGNVICVVDALDECEEKTLSPLIRHITRLPRSQTPDIPLKFLVTSRPYHKIERELGSPETTIRLKGEDEIEAITADVTRVIDEGVKSLESYWKRPGGLGYLRDLLESSADRTFLWVSLIIGILKDSEDDSREEFTNIVTTAPRDLAELYTRILDKSTHPDKARRILKIVVAATRPLTLREMNIAFRIKREHKSVRDLGDLPTEFERTVKNLCGLFVWVIDSRIYLVHQTAREFLIQGSLPGRGNWQYTLCPRDSNFVMADICLSYLSLQEFEYDPPDSDHFCCFEVEALDDSSEKLQESEYDSSDSDTDSGLGGEAFPVYVFEGLQDSEYDSSDSDTDSSLEGEAPGDSLEGLHDSDYDSSDSDTDSSLEGEAPGDSPEGLHDSEYDSSDSDTDSSLEGEAPGDSLEGLQDSEYDSSDLHTDGSLEEEALDDRLGKLQEFEYDSPHSDRVGSLEEEAPDDPIKKYALLEYSARHWPDHFRDSQGQQMELFELTKLICETGSNRFRTWIRIYWFYACSQPWFSRRLTHLMMASWLGQGTVVERLLEEGRDINARTKPWGTALNFAANARDRDITGKLLQRNVKARFGGEQYNILTMKQSELLSVLKSLKWWENLSDQIEFLLPFCIPDTPDMDTFAPPNTAPHSNTGMETD